MERQMDFQRYLGSGPVQQMGQGPTPQGGDPQQFMGQIPGQTPPQAYGAPPGAFPDISEVQPPQQMPQAPQMPNIGEPGGYGPAIFRLANFIRQYGQAARQRGY